jgi:cell division protein FtsL
VSNEARMSRADELTLTVLVELIEGPAWCVKLNDANRIIRELEARIAELTREQDQAIRERDRAILERDAIQAWKDGASGAAIISYPPRTHGHTESMYYAHRVTYETGPENYRDGADVVSDLYLFFRSEARQLTAERDQAIRERDELKDQLAQADAEADADTRQRAIESLSRNLEAETQRADRADRQRDDARRMTCCQMTHIDPSRQVGKLGRIALRQVADENWGPGEGKRLFAETEVDRG